MQKKYKVIFMGTPTIASCCLDAILKLSGVEVLAVVCQEDKPVGRKHIINFCPVKKTAISHNIKVLQAAKIDNLYEQIKELNPDLIMTCAFGQFIPNNILTLPKYKCINLHASLLPKYRGGAPIHHTILNNEKITGWSLMYMNNKMDAGDVIAQSQIKINPNETYKSLYQKLCLAIQPMINKHFLTLFNDKVQATKQNEHEATYAPNITHENEKINWNNLSANIDAKIRAFYDKPIAYCILEKQIVKIHQATITNIKSTKMPGIIENVTKNIIFVATQDNCIGLKTIQVAGKKPMDVAQIVNGNHPFKIGKVFA